MPSSDDVVLSLHSVDGLSAEQQDALRRLGISRVSELLRFRPVHDAQLVVAVALGRIVHDVELTPLLDAPHHATPRPELPALPVDALAVVDDATARELGDHFGIRTIGALARFDAFAAAQRVVAERAGAFHEPASAPPELMPSLVGAVQNTINFSTFVREKTLRLPGVELLFDEDRVHDIDPRLAALFPVRGLGPIFTVGRRSAAVGGGIRRGVAGVLPRAPEPEPELHLGYAARFRQDWVNMGTFLGEIQHSLALAPGESRNIATIDWKRTHVTRRDEDTSVKELLTNDLVHTRALDEVARSAAFELQFGGTGTAAGTAVASAAMVLGAAAVGGVAGAVPAAAVGTAVGAAVGSFAPVLGNGIGAAAGAAGGALIGFGAGAAIAGGAALAATAGVQLGVVRSDSAGARAILADLAQDITETTSQKASSIRSLWSTVFVSDTQAENESLQTRNVTNYNHSHALTIQYYEVLQRYRTEVGLAAAEPLLFLPFRPLAFTLDLVADYWTVLREGVTDPALRERFEVVLGRFDTRTGRFTEGDQTLKTVVVTVQRLVVSGIGAVGPPPRVTLLGTASPQTRLGDVAVFAFAADDQPAAPITGVQVTRLLPGSPVTVSTRATVTEPDGAERVYARTSGVLEADRDGSVDVELDIPVGPPVDELEASTEEVERFFNARRYTFTRRLLLSLEPEQLIDLVEALLFRRAIQVDIRPQTFRSPSPRVPLARPGFAARRPTFGAAFAEAAGNRVRQAVLATVTRHPGIDADAIEAVDDALDRAADSLRDVSDSPTAREAGIDRAVQAAAPTFQTVVPGLAAEAGARLRELLRELGEKLAGDAALVEEAVPLTELVDPTPFAVTGNTLVFRMRRPSAAVAARRLVADTPLAQAASFVDDLGAFVKAELERRTAVTRDLFLPTSGVFAEALLGRANASEKLDVTRFFHWQDSPIPHLAPAIAQLAAGSRVQDQLDGTGPTVPGSVLNIVNPAAFPDPTGLAGILTAIQNGDIFRDMSKAQELATVLGNLSQLAARTTEIAGTLAGDARADALKAANDIASTVARLAQTPTQQGLQQNLPPSPAPTPTPTPTPTPPTPTPIPNPPRPVSPSTRRRIAVTLRVFVEPEVWEPRPSILSVVTGLTSPIELLLTQTRFGGQGRPLGQRDGASMAEVTTTFTIDTATMEMVEIDGGRPRFAPADIFLQADTESVPDRPEWFEALAPGATPISLISGSTLDPTGENFGVRHDQDGTRPRVRFTLAARPYFPLTKQDIEQRIGSVTIPIGGVPIGAANLVDLLFALSVFDIDADVSVTFEKGADGELTAQVSGSHDGFPYYEVFVNDTLRYDFTPTDDTAPESLRAGFPPERIERPPFVVPRLPGE